jgi:hypothetical protein
MALVVGGWMILILSACSSTNVISGRVVDAATREPLASAVLSGERGGIYNDNPDKSKGNPAYVYSAVTDAKGFFELPLSSSQPVGLHAFVDGYRYGPLLVEAAGHAVVEVAVTKKLPEDLSPRISGVSLSSETVGSGQEVTITAMVRAGTSADPLSEEVLIVEPKMHFSVAMAPPTPGIPGRWPDGVWIGTFRAPIVRGAYTLFVVATTEGCVTADRFQQILTVQ